MSAQADGKTIGGKINPLDQELQNPRLLGREQFVPDRIEPLQRIANRGLWQSLDFRPGRAMYR